MVNFIKLELKYLQNYSVFLCLSFSSERKIWGLDIIYFPENLSLELLWYCDLAISFFCWPEIRIWSSLASTMGLTFWWNWNDFDQHDVNLCFFYLVTATHDISWPGPSMNITNLSKKLLNGLVSGHSRSFNLHLDFWKSRSWKIKVCFKPEFFSSSPPRKKLDWYHKPL